MPARVATDDDLRAAVLLVQEHGSITAAATAANLPRTTLASRLSEARRRGFSVDPAPVLGLPYEREWQTWNTHIGALRSRYQGPCKRPARVGRLKIVVLSDLHAPFHDPAFVTRVVHDEADADIAVILGDLGDGYSLSRFTKYETVPYEQEIAAVTHLLERFSETWPLVKLLEGNHDSARLEKRLRDTLPQDFIAAIQVITGGSLSPLEALCRRFANIELCGLKVGEHSVPWMTQVGDAIFCHAEKFSVVPGSALRKVEEWLSDNERHLGLSPWRLVVQAHTHQLCLMPWAADKLLVECGCLCTLPGYALSARIGGRPQRNGYVTLEQIDGKTDLDSVRLHWLNADAQVA